MSGHNVLLIQWIIEIDGTIIKYVQYEKQYIHLIGHGCDQRRKIDSAAMKPARKEEKQVADDGQEKARNQLGFCRTFYLT